MLYGPRGLGTTCAKSMPCDSSPSLFTICAEPELAAIDAAFRIDKFEIALNTVHCGQPVVVFSLLRA